MAETRAEGRALARVLNINVCSAEEISAGGVTRPTYKGDTTDESQEMAIESLTSRLKIDMDKFIAQQAGIPASQLSSLSSEKAANLIELLVSYKDGKKKIPADIMA